MANLIFIMILVCVSGGMGKKYEEKPEWAKKDIRDFTDADMERYFIDKCA